MAAGKKLEKKEKKNMSEKADALAGDIFFSDTKVFTAEPQFYRQNECSLSTSS